MFFLVTYLIILVGALIHCKVDKSEKAHTKVRHLELFLLWFVVGSGVSSIFSGILHMSGQAPEMAESIGYTSSMFQWEVGGADIAIGVLGVVCAWRRDFLLPALTAWLISYWIDGVGHIMQWTQHDNDKPNNVGAIPSDFLAPLIGFVLYFAWNKARGVSRLGHVKTS